MQWAKYIIMTIMPLCAGYLQLHTPIFKRHFLRYIDQTIVFDGTIETAKWAEGSNSNQTDFKVDLE